MLRKLIVLTLALLLALPALAMANFRMGDTTFTLSGSGSSDTDFDSNNFIADFSLGHFFTDTWEGSVRQGVAFDGRGDSTLVNAATSLAIDYNFNTYSWVPFLGASVGYIYGAGVDDTGFAGPEIGLKYFVNNTTYLQGIVQYQWFFDRMSDVDSFDDDRFVYGLGMGVRW